VVQKPALANRPVGEERGEFCFVNAQCSSSRLETLADPGFLDLAEQLWVGGAREHTAQGGFRSSAAHLCQTNPGDVCHQQNCVRAEPLQCFDGATVAGMMGKCAGS
jgi:hypothetical protein